MTDLCAIHTIIIGLDLTSRHAMVFHVPGFSTHRPIELASLPVAEICEFPILDTSFPISDGQDAAKMWNSRISAVGASCRSTLILLALHSPDLPIGCTLLVLRSSLVLANQNVCSNLAGQSECVF